MKQSSVSPASVEPVNTPKTKKWYQKKWLWISAILGLIFLIWVFSGEEKSKYQTEKIKRMDIEQIISVTGQIEADPQVDMNFQTVGKVKAIYKQKGEHVEEGDIVAELENDAQTIAVNTAQAELEAALGNLEQRIAGASSEERAVAQTVVTQSENNLKLAKTDLNNAQKITQKNIEKSQLQVNKSQIEAEQAQKDFNDLKITTAEEIKSAEKDVETALVNLQKAEVELKNALLSNDKDIKDTYKNLRTSINKTLITINNSLIESDNILGEDNKTVNDSFERLLGVLDSDAIPQAENQYRRAKASYQNAKQFLDDLSPDATTELEKAYSLLQTAFEDCDELLDDIAHLLNSTITSTDLTAASLETFKTDINTLQTSLNTSNDTAVSRYQTMTSSLLNSDTTDEQAQAAYEISKNTYEVTKQTLSKVKAEASRQLNTADSQVRETQNLLQQAQQNFNKVQTESENTIASNEAQLGVKKSSLLNAQANLKLVNADPREVDIKSLRARVEQARANLALAEYELSKTRITSPVAGIVAKVNMEIGETYLGSSDRELVTAAVRVVADKLKVTADVPETDIIKIKSDDIVEMTIDAFPATEKFKGHITKIDPAETLISGVVYYRIEADLELDYPGIKPGMTANLDIFTAKSPNTLAVPLRGILFEDIKTFVRVLENKELVKKEIKLGLEGDLYIEVLEGLNEGDEIVLKVNGD